MCGGSWSALISGTGSKELSAVAGSGNEIEFEVARQLIPTINSFMVNKNVNISAIEQKRKLEDYFIKMIQNED